MWQRAQTPIQKLKQNAQTQNPDAMQAMSVLYMTLLEAVSQQLYVSCEEAGWLRVLCHPLFSPPLPPFPVRFQPRDIQYIKTKNRLTSPVVRTL